MSNQLKHVPLTQRSLNSPLFTPLLKDCVRLVFLKYYSFFLNLYYQNTKKYMYKFNNYYAIKL